MRFDDRLATLLTLPVAGPHSRSVRWRQLVELAARMSEAEQADSAPMVAALAVIRSERDAIPLGVRSAAARAVAGRALGPELLDLFAEDELAVAAPVLAAANPDAETRARLVAAASGDTRQFLAALWPQEGGDATETQAGRRLGEVVEQLKAARNRLADDLDPPPGETPSAPRHDPAPIAPHRAAEPAGDLIVAAPSEITAFDWEAGADGALIWVEGAPRAALIGTSLFADPALAAPVGARRPFADVEVELGGLPGRWRLAGAPQHDEQSGQFLGYRGRARRADLAPATETRAPAKGEERATPPAGMGLPQDPAMLRELVHELKTPLNAIIGFAEIIDGQYLGPAHRRYRERAAEIVAQARILLEAIKDLDFAARLQARDRRPDPQPLGELVKGLRGTLEAHAARCDVGLEIGGFDAAAPCVTDAGLAGRLVERLVGAMIDAAGEGERLRIRGGANDEGCELVIDLPARLADKPAAELVDPALVVDRAGKALLGTGFSLRLVRGLARVGGGDLLFEDGTARLVLPRAG